MSITTSCAAAYGFSCTVSCYAAPTITYGNATAVVYPDGTGTIRVGGLTLSAEQAKKLRKEIGNLSDILNAAAAARTRKPRKPAAKKPAKRK